MYRLTTIRPIRYMGPDKGKADTNANGGGKKSGKQSVIPKKKNNGKSSEEEDDDDSGDDDDDSDEDEEDDESDDEEDSDEDDDSKSKKKKKSSQVPTPKSLKALVKDNPKLQEEINAIIEAREARDANKAKKEALRAKGAWEKLSNQQQDEIADLQRQVDAHDSVIEEREQLRVLLNNNIDVFIKDWPKSLKKTDPGKDDVVNRIKWMESSSDLAKELKAGGASPDPEGNKGGNGKKKLDLADSMFANYNPPPVAIRSGGNNK